MKRRCLHHQRGMTLIELLVAMSLMAILSVLGYKGFSALLITRERLMAVSTQWVDLARVFARLGGELDRLPGDVPGRLRLDGDDGRQVLTLQLPSSLLPSGVDTIVYRIDPNGLAWSTARAAGQSFALLDEGFRVQWRVQLADGRWSPSWGGGNSARPRLLEMRVTQPGVDTVTRYWSLP